jgi:hypothetical protein
VVMMCSLVLFSSRLTTDFGEMQCYITDAGALSIHVMSHNTVVMYYIYIQSCSHNYINYY